MILYHIEKSKYKDVWPPEGPLYAEGRWNKMGQWIIYTSPTVALAKLETLANQNNLPVKRVCLSIEVSDDCLVYDITSSSLPENWMEKPYPSTLANLTAAFLSSDCLMMKVPSAQNFRDYNYLINVRHKDFHRDVKLLEVFDEDFDPRLKS